MRHTIAVHLPRTYPELVGEACSEGKAQSLRDLASITLGDWARVSDIDAATVTQIVGVYRGTIVSAYEPNSYTRGEDRRVRWEASSADHLAGHIGCPVPGGPWVRGEARPLRSITLDSKPHPDGLSAAAASWMLVGEMSRYNHEPADRDTAEALLRRIQVTATKDSVTISVPAGTSVLVNQRSEA